MSVPWKCDPIYPEGVDPDSLTIGWKCVLPDLRSGHTGTFRYPWPGNWATVEHPDKVLPGDACGYGLHIAKTFRGATSLTRLGTVLIVGYVAGEVAAEDDHKLRVPRLAVLDIVDALGQIADGRADLTGANLARADLYGANLARADLYGANLAGANLTGADLTGANLYGANLTGANLTGADLTRADLTGARRYASDPPIPRWRRDDLTGRLLRKEA